MALQNLATSIQTCLRLLQGPGGEAHLSGPPHLPDPAGKSPRGAPCLGWLPAPPHRGLELRGWRMPGGYVPREVTRGPHRGCRERHRLRASRAILICLRLTRGFWPPLRPLGLEAEAGGGLSGYSVSAHTGRAGQGMPLVWLLCPWREGWARRGPWLGRMLQREGRLRQQAQPVSVCIAPTGSEGGSLRLMLAPKGLS